LGFLLPLVDKTPLHFLPVRYFPVLHFRCARPVCLHITVQAVSHPLIHFHLFRPNLSGVLLFRGRRALPIPFSSRAVVVVHRFDVGDRAHARPRWPIAHGFLLVWSAAFFLSRQFYVRGGEIRGSFVSYPDCETRHCVYSQM